MDPSLPMIAIGNQTSCWAVKLTEPFDYALANGFDAFEWFPDKKPEIGWDESDLPAAYRRTIQETACARRMRLSVHARWEANPLQPASRAQLEEDLQLARDLGAALLNVHLYHEQGLAGFVGAIAWLARATAEVGIQLAFENTPLHAPEDFNELFARLHELKAVPTGHLGLCLDPGHANLCAATRHRYLDFVDRLDPALPITHLHLHENWGDRDSHLPLFTGPAAQDDAGMRGLLRRLQQRNYAGSIILEQWPQPPELLVQARDRLRQMLSGWAGPGAVGSPCHAPQSDQAGVVRGLLDGKAPSRPMPGPPL
jgi:sugar phosphate isomerase/epimerase